MSGHFYEWHASFKVGAEIEFFVAPKCGRAAIFESLILEFVTRLRGVQAQV
uniref:Uncharacterized protein n=1 Tax=uncultured Verrucomicrobiota bacterium TaxID=156588 RepID=D2DXS7_9BACT|nr:hypothetical protein [uncultured Verrucomicrobiota bacterium]